MEALQFYRAKSTDFGDAFLCAFARSEGCVVATFDKGTVKEFTELDVLAPTECLAKMKLRCRQEINFTR